MTTLSWDYNGVKQTVTFANADDAKLCWQALATNGILATFRIPEGYKEIPFKRYEGDGLLSDKQIEELKARLDKMVLVH